MQVLSSPVSFGVLVLLVSCFSVVGCGSDANQFGPTGSEIQAYIDENPDMIATREDAPADEAAEFEAGNFEAGDFEAGNG